MSELSLRPSGFFCFKAFPLPITGQLDHLATIDSILSPVLAVDFAVQKNSTYPRAKTPTPRGPFFRANLASLNPRKPRQRLPCHGRVGHACAGRGGCEETRPMSLARRFQLARRVCLTCREDGRGRGLTSKTLGWSVVEALGPTDA